MNVFRYLTIAITKMLTKVFGIATLSFFGRMPSREDDKIALVGIVSLSWLPIFAAYFLPDFAQMIIPFAPDDDEVTRMIALALAVVMPLIVGVTIAMMRNNRSRGPRHIAVQMLLALPYTVIIGLTVTLIVILVPLIKISFLTRRFETMRILVMIETEAYQGTLQHIIEQLRAHDIKVSVSDPNRVINALFGVLAWVLGRIFCREVAEELRVLQPQNPDVDRDEWFEIMLHSADITIIGPQEIASRIHAILVDAMDERVLYLTWDDESQALEDRIRQARQRLDDGDLPERSETTALVEDLAELALGREEWDAVRRLIYRLERDVEARRADRALATKS